MPGIRQPTTHVSRKYGPKVAVRAGRKYLAPQTITSPSISKIKNRIKGSDRRRFKNAGPLLS
ncbi:MAG: hypothetical protein ACXVZH_08945 [Terriglobales bacterium]